MLQLAWDWTGIPDQRGRLRQVWGDNEYSSYGCSVLFLGAVQKEVQEAHQETGSGAYRSSVDAQGD